MTRAAEFGLDLTASESPAESTWFDAKEDDWEFQDGLRRAHRILATSTVRLDSVAESSGLHAPELAIPALPVWPVAAPALPPKRRPRGLTQAVAWTMLSLGLMTFVCGAVLLGWSYFKGNHQLWSLGLPLALVGQAGLVIGFVLQSDRRPEEQTPTAEQLPSVEQRILELRNTATMLSTTHSPPARAFYSHMAEGASPHILLADLKGQLDLLALRMSQG